MTKCIVTGQILDTGDAPVVEALVSARASRGLNDIPFTDAGAVIADAETTTKTDEHGYFSLALQRGLVVILRINSANMAMRLLVPNQDTVTLRDWIENGRI